MVEKIYYLVEEITMIVCLFGLYGKKVKFDILAISALLVNILIYNCHQEGYIGEIHSFTTISVIMLYSIYEFNKNIRTTIINMLLCIILISALQLMCMLPIGLIKMVVNNDDILWISVNLIILLTVLILKEKFAFISRFVLESRWLSAGLISLGVLEIITLVVNYKVHNMLKFDIYFTVLTFIILLICILQRWYANKREVLLKEQQLKIASIYSGTFDKFAEDVIKRQHDIKNHFNAIFSMHYTCNSYEELVDGQRKYCDDILHLARFDRLLNLNMPILAGFLYSKFHEIEEAGVKVDYKLKLDAEELSVPMYEMITVLGILIDNAKEKAETLEQAYKVIKIDISEDDRYVYFMFKNISEYIKINDMEKLFKRGYSTKGNNRGIGLSTVREKALKYNFDVLVENEKVDEQNWIVFGIIVKK